MIETQKYRMKFFGLATVLGVTILTHSFPAKADNPESWRSLDSVIEALAEDKTILAYLASRCGSLFLSLSKAFSGRSDSKEISISMLDKGTGFLVMSASVNLQIGGEEKTQANIQRQMDLEKDMIIDMSNAYIERMLQNYKTQGGFFEQDAFMKNEINTCVQAYEALNQ